MEARKIQWDPIAVSKKEAREKGKAKFRDATKLLSLNNKDNDHHTNKQTKEGAEPLLLKGDRN